MGRLFFCPQATFRHSGIHWLCGHGGGGHAITNNLHHLEPDYVQTLPNMTRRRCDSSALGFASLRPLEGCFSPLSGFILSPESPLISRSRRRIAIAINSSKQLAYGPGSV
jgi:hypothetical protein